MMKLYSTGKPHGFKRDVIGRCTRVLLPGAQNEDQILLVGRESYGKSQYFGCAAILTDKSFDGAEGELPTGVPMISGIESLDYLEEGDIVRLAGSNGQIKSLFRVNSTHNVLFATDNCNSHCVMCSQPPKKKDDSFLIEENRRLIRLIDRGTKNIGISGGEPTLLKESLFAIMRDLKEYLPDTDVTMLSNGRMFCYRTFAEKFAAVDHKRFVTAIPLYSDTPEIHNNVVQARNAFAETMRGYYNLGELRQRIEVRVVLHALTYKRLPKLAEFIYRNLPFVEHIALMGLEIVGYAKKNQAELWIDPFDYQKELSEAVEFLSFRGMNVSIYNIPLCVLPRGLWGFARKSISDWKNVYADECSKCTVLAQCGGFFKWSPEVRSAHIHAI